MLNAKSAGEKRAQVASVGMDEWVVRLALSKMVLCDVILVNSDRHWRISVSSAKVLHTMLHGVENIVHVMPFVIYDFWDTMCLRPPVFSL